MEKIAGISEDVKWTLLVFFFFFYPGLTQSDAITVYSYSNGDYII